MLVLVDVLTSTSSPGSRLVSVWRLAYPWSRVAWPPYSAALFGPVVNELGVWSTLPLRA